MKQLRALLVISGSLAVITGLAYPLLITGASRLLFRDQARGSLIVRDGKILGSRLIAQHSEDPRYFWGRLSATGDFPTNAASSGGSNLAPSNPDLQKATQVRVQALKDADPGNISPIPVDLVSASGSGLDPHISPAAAAWQVPRVARARSLPESDLAVLVARFTSARTFGFLGEPRVNVLLLNHALDEKRP